MPPQSWETSPGRAVALPPVAAPAAPVPFWGSVTANFEDQRDTRRRNARYEATDSALWDRHRDLERRLGRRLPLSRSLAGVGAQDGQSLLDRLTFDPEAINAAILGRPGLLEDDAYEAMIEAERAKDPTKFDGVERREELAARLSARFNASRQRAAEASEGVAGMVGAFIGGTAGTFTDPAQAGVTLATGGLGAGRALLTRMGVQALAGAGTEALDVGQRGVDAARYGGPAYTAGEALADIGMSAAGSAAFEPLGDALKAGWRAARGAAAPADPGARGFTDAVDRLFEDEAAIGAAADFDGARAALARGEPPPAVEMERSLDDLFADGAAGPGSQMQPGSLADYLPEGLAGGGRRSQPGPMPGADGGLQAADYMGRTIHAGRFDPLTIDVDAARFQYKAEGDAEGVTGRLRGVERWDATASGKAILFEDMDGRRIVADGHQRRGLARRLAEQGWEDAMLDGYLFRAADGWTAREVRIVAALKNIREGSGQIMDAAKLFREAPGALRDRSLPVTGDFIAQARQLASLSDDGFRAVVNGVIPERYAAIIGEQAAGRPELHGDLVELIRRAEPKSAEGARAMVQEGLLDDFIKTEGMQLDLFGGLPRESTVIARGRIREAVMSALRRDARLNAALVRHADAIETGGNVLARSANEQALAVDRAASELVSRLALRSGEMGEAFAQAAAAVTKGEASAGAAAKGLVARIRAAVAAGERLDELRAEVLTPDAPGAVARELAAEFDQPGGAGQRGQIADKPEDVDVEAEAESLGLFDDIPDTTSEDRALSVLKACAPGAS